MHWPHKQQYEAISDNKIVIIRKMVKRRIETNRKKKCANKLIWPSKLRGWTNSTEQISFSIALLFFAFHCMQLLWQKPFKGALIKVRNYLQIEIELYAILWYRQMTIAFDACVESIVSLRKLKKTQTTTTKNIAGQSYCKLLYVVKIEMNWLIICSRIWCSNSILFFRKFENISLIDVSIWALNGALHNIE